MSDELDPIGQSELQGWSDPQVISQNAALGAIADNGVTSKDIQGYVGKATDFYTRRLQQESPDLSDTEKAQRRQAFEDALGFKMNAWAIDNTKPGKLAVSANWLRSAASWLGFGVGAQTEETAKAYTDLSFKRLDEGRATPADFETLAMESQRAKADRERGMLGQVGEAIHHLVPVATDFAATGGIKTGAEELAARALPGFAARGVGAMAQGAAVAAGESSDPKTLIHDTIGNSLQGYVGTFAPKAPAGFVGKVVGTLQSAFTGLATGEASEELQKYVTKTSPQGGTVSRYLSGDPNAVRDLAAQGIAFTAFEAVMHAYARGEKIQPEKAAEDAIKAAATAEATQTATETPQEAESPSAPSAPTVPDAPGTPISTEGGAKPVVDTAQPEAQAGTPVQAEAEAPLPKNKGGRPEKTEEEKALTVSVRKVKKAHAELVKGGLPDRFAAWESGADEGPGRPTLAYESDDSDKLDAFITHVEKAVAAAQKAGIDPNVAMSHIEGLHDTIAALTPQLEKLFQDVSKVSNKEVDDAANRDGRRLARNPASVQRAVDSDIQGQIQNAGTIAESPQNAPGNEAGAGSGKPAATVPEAASNELTHAVVVRPSFGARLRIVFRGSKEEATAKMRELKARSTDPTSYHEAVDAEFAKQEGYPDLSNELRPEEMGGPGAMGSIPPAPPSTEAPGAKVGVPATPSPRTSSLRDMWHRLSDYMGEIGGKMYPRTTRESRESGEKLAQLASVEVYSPERAKEVMQLMGIDKMSDAGLTELGTTAQEYRHRIAKKRLMARAQQSFAESEALRQQGKIADAADAANRGHDDQKAARGIVTFVGQENSPLKSEEDFQRNANAPGFKAFMQKWQQVMVPEMDTNLRSAMGMDDTDPINSITQVPGFPINAKPVRPGEDIPKGTIFIGGKGNFKNLRIGKSPFANRATLAGDAYDTHMGRMIENSIRLGSRAARKAEVARTLVEDGPGSWSPSGQRIDGWKEIPFTSPPKDTQTANPGDVLYVREGIAGEVIRGFNANEPEPMPALLRWLTKGVNTVQMAGLTDAEYHAKNVMSMMTKSGMSPLDLAKNMQAVLKNDPQIQSRLTELAKMGALRAEHQGISPVGHGIDVLDRAMRLTASDAFDRMVKRYGGGVENTETARRDFINQLGQYNAKAMNPIMAAMKRSGLSPFIVAGTNFNVQGLKSLVGGHGIATTNVKTDLALRAETLARVVTPFALAAGLNYLINHRADGDQNTPVGAVKIGEHNGKTMYLNLGEFSGADRGARETGLLPTIEALRYRGQTNQADRDKAWEGAVMSQLHPLLGPAVNLGSMLFRGKSAAGYQTAAKGEHVPFLKSTAENLNPAVSIALGADRPHEKTDAVEKAARILGPFGPQFRSRPPVALPHR